MSAPRISVRTLIALLVLTPVSALAVVSVFLSYSTSSRVAQSLGVQILIGATAGASERVRDYLSGAERLSELYTSRLALGSLLTDDLSTWERPMLHDLLTSPDVASICFGASDGRTTWLLRNRGRLEVGRVSGPGADSAVEFVMNADGSAEETPIRRYSYDPRQRPWYSVAQQSADARWTPIYFWFGQSGEDSQTGAGFTRAVRAPDGALKGVLVIDVTLGALSGFLRSLPIAQNGHVFITDELGLLVASSEGTVNSSDGERLALADSTSSTARSVAAVIADQSAGRWLTGSREYLFESPNGPARALVTRLAPSPGIDWRVITVLPDAVIFRDTAAAQRRALILAVLVTLVAAGMGLLFSARAGAIFSALRDHARRIGQGDLNTRAPGTLVRELDELSTDLNRMADQLAQRLDLQTSLELSKQAQSIADRRASTDQLAAAVAAGLLDADESRRGPIALGVLLDSFAAAQAHWLDESGRTTASAPEPVRWPGEAARALVRWALARGTRGVEPVAQASTLAWSARAFLEELGAASVIALPLRRGDEVVGALALAWSQHSASLGADQLASLRAAAKLFASASRRAETPEMEATPAGAIEAQSTLESPPSVAPLFDPRASAALYPDQRARAEFIRSGMDEIERFVGLVAASSASGDGAGAAASARRVRSIASAVGARRLARAASEFRAEAPSCAHELLACRAAVLRELAAASRAAIDAVPSTP